MHSNTPDKRAERLGGLGRVDGDAAQSHEEVDVHVHAIDVHVELRDGAATHAGVDLNQAGAILGRHELDVEAALVKPEGLEHAVRVLLACSLCLGRQQRRRVLSRLQEVGRRGGAVSEMGKHEE